MHFTNLYKKLLCFFSCSVLIKFETDKIEIVIFHFMVQSGCHKATIWVKVAHPNKTVLACWSQIKKRIGNLSFGITTRIS